MNSTHENPKPLNAKQQIFVNEMIKHGNKQLAYHKAYPHTTGESLKASARRLWNESHIKIRIKEAQMRIQKETEENFTTALKEELAAMKGIRETLATIVGGAMKFEKYYKLDGKMKPFETKASCGDVISALNLCFKITKEMPVMHVAKNREFNVAGTPFK